MTSYHNKFKAFLYPNVEWADEKRKIVKGFIPEMLSLKFHEKMPKGGSAERTAKTAPSLSILGDKII